MALQRISIKDVVDFSFCPKYYDLKHLDEKECNMKEAYNISLHECFYSYLRALQNDALRRPLEHLKVKWGEEWIQQKTNSEIVLTPSSFKRDSYEAKRKSGIEAITTFHNLMDTPQYPIAVNMPYEVNITKDIILTGTWEYIREAGTTKSKEFQLLKFRIEHNKFQVAKQAHHDLELTAAVYAFLKKFNTSTVRPVYVDIYKKALIMSARDKNDFKMLAHTVISVVKCLEYNIRCISPDNRCYHCEYRNQCLKT